MVANWDGCARRMRVGRRALTIDVDGTLVGSHSDLRPAESLKEAPHGESESSATSLSRLDLDVPPLDAGAASQLSSDVSAIGAPWRSATTSLDRPDRRRFVPRNSQFATLFERRPAGSLVAATSGRAGRPTAASCPDQGSVRVVGVLDELEAAAAGLGGTAIANAASSGATGATGSSGAGGRQDRGAGETALTGDTAAKVRAAALAKVPGTVLRVEDNRGGVYEAHVRRADGTEVEVAVNRAFEITGVSERGPGGRGGPGGHDPGGGEDLSAVASKLGVSEAKLRAAVDAARPTGDRGPRGDRAVALARALGVKTADVQEILEANHPERSAGGPRHERGGRPDQSALIADLAQGLSLDTAKVEAAVSTAETDHGAEHAARHTALDAAAAKAVGKSTADVKAAFEAARPAHRAP